MATLYLRLVPMLYSLAVLSQVLRLRSGPNKSMLSLHIERGIEQAAEFLRKNGVIAYPTDTLYGLGGNPFSLKALARILDVKGRSAHKGLPLLLAEAEDVLLVARPDSPFFDALADAFWPGPLTLVLPPVPGLPETVLGPTGAVGVRVPDHPVPRDLARALGKPIVGTSANPSGGPDPITAQDVERSLGRKIDCIVDGGPAHRGQPSSVVDLTGERPRMLRTGAISPECIRKVLGIEIQ